jgi:hypothetical protein
VGVNTSHSYHNINIGYIGGKVPPVATKHQHFLLAREVSFMMSSSSSPLTTQQFDSRHTDATMPSVARIIRHSLCDQTVAHIEISKRSGNLHDNQLVAHDDYNAIQ